VRFNATTLSFKSSDHVATYKVWLL